MTACIDAQNRVLLAKVKAGNGKREGTYLSVHIVYMSSFSFLNFEVANTFNFHFWLEVTILLIK